MDFLVVANMKLYHKRHRPLCDQGGTSAPPYVCVYTAPARKIWDVNKLELCQKLSNIFASVVCEIKQVVCEIKQVQVKQADRFEKVGSGRPTASKHAAARNKLEAIHRFFRFATQVKCGEGELGQTSGFHPRPVCPPLMQQGQARAQSIGKHGQVGVDDSVVKTASTRASHHGRRQQTR